MKDSIMKKIYLIPLITITLPMHNNLIFAGEHIRIENTFSVPTTKVTPLKTSYDNPYNAFLFELRTANLTEAKKILEEHHLDINKVITIKIPFGKDKDKETEGTALLVACESGSLETVNFVLESGANSAQKIKHSNGNYYTAEELVQKKLDERNTEIQSILSALKAKQVK